jgi:Secretion system C-terminal sorting domain
MRLLLLPIYFSKTNSMKTGSYIKRCFLLIFLGGQLLVIPKLKAQICQHPLDSVYSMNTLGVLYPISVTNALNGTPINTAGSAANSNGLGFSTLDGKFYFFNQVGSGTTQFTSYDPVSHVLTTLPGPSVANLLTTQKIRTGCVNNLGSGYYTINPDNGGTTTPALYYYNIATLTWTTITTSFKDPSSVSLNTTFNNLNSGDMAFDGSGNLWIILSKATQYALYKIAAPVPTTAVASVTAIPIIAPTATPLGVSFTGMAFNSAGTLFLSTGAGVAAGNNLLYKITSVSLGLTLVGTLAVNDMGADLTACSAPLFVLPVSSLQHFTAVLRNNGVELSWTATEDESIAGYNIEYSKDGEHWTTIGSVEKKLSNPGTTNVYNFVQSQYAPDNNFYRITQKLTDGKQNISAIKLVNGGRTSQVAIGPNPAKDILYINNTGNISKYLAQVFDRSGRLVYTTSVDQTQQTVNISHLQKGSYFLKLSSPVNNSSTSYQFIKW